MVVPAFPARRGLECLSCGKEESGLPHTAGGWCVCWNRGNKGCTCSKKQLDCLCCQGEPAHVAHMAKRRGIATCMMGRGDCLSCRWQEGDVACVVHVAGRGGEQHYLCCASSKGILGSPHNGREQPPVPGSWMALRYSMGFRVRHSRNICKCY